MNIEQFRATLGTDAPPVGLPPLLEALWHDASGNWQRAHEITQDERGNDACWVHAYLHRVEGDLPNAGYWYRRAQRDVCTQPLATEWATIAEALLG